MKLYQLLEYPAVYRAAQAVLAPGMDRILTHQLARATAGIRRTASVLDVGCGPSSWLWKFGIRPIGLDLLHKYTTKYLSVGGACVTASAGSLPFSADSFDAVFSYGLLH